VAAFPSSESKAAQRKQIRQIGALADLPESTRRSLHIGGSARVLLELLDHSSLKERCRVNRWVCGVLAGAGRAELASPVSR